jgi:HJR/Mrr/RecB family endonuclease
VTKIANPGNIERVSNIIFTIAQIIYVLWPLFIITALAYSFQGRLTWNAFSRRVRQSLLTTWVVLFLIWLFTLFAPLPTPGLIPEPWNTLAFLCGFFLLLIIEASRLGLLRRRLRAHIELRHTRSLDHLKIMDPYDFEYLVAETYRSLGYQATQVGHSGDHGIDVKLLAPDGKDWIVQCKRYGSTVGESVVRELYGTMISEKAARAALVTTAQITSPAREWARGKPIDLVDGPALLKMMDDAQRRSEGTLLSRLSIWFEQLIEADRPAGLRQPGQNTKDLSATQPVHVQQGSASPLVYRTPTIHYNGSAPVCPHCGVLMIPRPLPRPLPRPAQNIHQSNRLLYRCRNYPECRIVLEPRQHN